MGLPPFSVSRALNVNGNDWMKVMMGRWWVSSFKRLKERRGSPDSDLELQLPFKSIETKNINESDLTSSPRHRPVPLRKNQACRGGQRKRIGRLLSGPWFGKCNSGVINNSLYSISNESQPGVFNNSNSFL